jgi:hypothetical protein
MCIVKRPPPGGLFYFGGGMLAASLKGGDGLSDVEACVKRREESN